MADEPGKKQSQVHDELMEYARKLRETLPFAPMTPSEWADAAGEHGRDYLTKAFGGR